MTERNTDCPGLRERKRRETRMRIEDCATRLILERGFDQVTLEEICEDAGVSRRTFFNYFDSKDQAVAGSGLPPVSQDDLDSFATVDSENIVRAILEYLGERIDTDPDTSPALSPDRATALAIRRRRRAILGETPHLLVAGMRRFDELAGTVQETITRHLTTFPGRRRAPHLSAPEEATLLTGVVRQCLVTAPLLYRDADVTRREALYRTGRDLVHLAAAYGAGWDRPPATT